MFKQSQLEVCNGPKLFRTKGKLGKHHYRHNLNMLNLMEATSCGHKIR